MTPENGIVLKFEMITSFQFSKVELGDVGCEGLCQMRILWPERDF